MTATPDFSIAQIVGCIALCFGVTAFQMRTRVAVLAVMATANAFWALHFLLLGAYTGAALNLVSIMRNAAFMRWKDRCPGPLLPTLVITVLAGAAAATWRGPLSGVALAAASCGTIAFWQRHPRNTRRWSLLSSPLWLTHNALQGSYPGVIIEVLVMGSILIGMWRHDRRPRA